MTTQTTSYDKQPIGLPDERPVLLDSADISTVFESLLDAIQQWEADEEILPWVAGHRRLQDLARALLIMSEARVEASAHVTEACLADREAAEEWSSARWRARMRLGEQARRAARETTMPHGGAHNAQHPATDASDAPTEE